ncbi:MFS transporter [Niallia taxi]|uniref:MFS transporter n=2 Tax=Niallia taxi TaxID=2499688 RepID=UPI002041C8FC|nr:MFS transporter [Niallia taxi]MCM3216671.1 MFS transporter [Niallia taxi]
MLNLMLIWTILEKKGSIVHLGIAICIMSIVPYLVQKYVKSLKLLMSTKPLIVFGSVRILGILVLAMMFFVLDTNSVYTYYLVGGIFACIFFLSMQSLEAYMSQKVIEGKINSSVASNNLQAAVQVGAFGGNSLTGILLAVGGIKLVGLILSLTLIIGVCIPLFLPLLADQKTKGISNLKKQEATEEEEVTLNPSINKNVILSLTVIGVTVLTIQLASINFLLPIIVHDVFEWSSVQYGVIGAAMGLGAFVATILGKWNKYVPNSIFILILVIDLLIGQLAYWSVAIVLGFVLGLVFNHSRIYQRILMFNFITSNDETVIWSGRTTVAFQFTKALIPLVLVFPLSLIGDHNAGLLLGIIGVIVTVLLGIIYWCEKRWTVSKYHTTNTLGVNNSVK